MRDELADLIKSTNPRGNDNAVRRAIADVLRRGGQVDGYPECSHCERQVPTTDPAELARLGWHPSGLEAPLKPNDASWTCDPCWSRLQETGELPGS